MPELHRDTAAILRLYNQTRAWNTLPCSGGLLDQPADVMEMLDVAESEAQRWRQKRIDDEESEMRKQESLRRMKG